MIAIAAPALLAPRQTGNPDNVDVNTFHQDLDSYAAYTQGDFKLIEPLTLQRGGRWPVGG